MRSIQRSVIRLRNAKQLSPRREITEKDEILDRIMQGKNKLCLSDLARLQLKKERDIEQFGESNNGRLTLGNGNGRNLKK